jgi:hypothetical protein
VYEDTIQHCSEYFDFEQWRNSECCVILSSDQFAPLGLVTPGTVTPCQITIRCELENRNCVYDGQCPELGDPTLQTANDQPQECILGEDQIRGRLTCVAVFKKGVCTIAPSSVVVSTMSLAQSQAAEILSRNP